MRDAVIMGAVEAVFTAWAMYASFHQAPLYSWTVGIVVCIPGAWLGGILRARAARPKAIPQVA